MDRGTDIGKTTLQELYLLGRDAAANKLDEIFAGKSQELCLRTRFPREVKPFVAAYLVRRGELDLPELHGAEDRDEGGHRCEHQDHALCHGIGPPELHGMAIDDAGLNYVPWGKGLQSWPRSA